MERTLNGEMMPKYTDENGVPTKEGATAMFYAAEASAARRSKATTHEDQNQLYRDNVPAWALASLNQYALFSRRPGDALLGFLTNDLRKAIDHADPNTRRAFFDIWQYIYNRMPGSCHGSKQIVKTWLGESKYGGHWHSLRHMDLVWPGDGEPPEYVTKEIALREKHFKRDEQRCAEER